MTEIVGFQRIWCAVQDEIPRTRDHGIESSSHQNDHSYADAPPSFMSTSQSIPHACLFPPSNRSKHHPRPTQSHPPPPPSTTLTATQLNLQLPAPARQRSFPGGRRAGVSIAAHCVSTAAVAVACCGPELPCQPGSRSGAAPIYIHGWQTVRGGRDACSLGCEKAFDRWSRRPGEPQVM